MIGIEKKEDFQFIELLDAIRIKRKHKEVEILNIEVFYFVLPLFGMMTHTTLILIYLN